MRRLVSLAIGAAAMAMLPNGASADGGAVQRSGGRYNWGSPHAPGMPSRGGWTAPGPAAVQMGRAPGARGHARSGRWHGGGNWSGRHSTHIRFHRGHILPRFWVRPTFFVGNWGGYGFPAPGLGRNWIRYYDDALLIDDHGYVHDQRYDVDWDRYDHGPVPAYATDGDGEDLFYDDDEVTWEGGRGADVASADVYPTQPYTLPYPTEGESRVYHVPYGATVTITPPVAVTTTTRTYVEEVPRRRRR